LADFAQILFAKQPAWRFEIKAIRLMNAAATPLLQPETMKPES
jgi:hypothetical protein